MKKKIKSKEEWIEENNQLAHQRRDTISEIYITFNNGCAEGCKISIEGAGYNELANAFRRIAEYIEVFKPKSYICYDEGKFSSG